MQCLPAASPPAWRLQVESAQAVGEQGMQRRVAFDGGHGATQRGEHGAVATEAAGSVQNMCRATAVQTKRSCQRRTLAGSGAAVNVGAVQIDVNAVIMGLAGTAQRQPILDDRQIKAGRWL